VNAAMLRAWALPWLVAALALRLFFAPGLMPASDARGLTITICSGASDHVRDPSGAPAKACPFTALAAPALAADPSLPAPPVRAARRVLAALFAAVAAAPARHAPAPPARAPPTPVTLPLLNA